MAEFRVHHLVQQLIEAAGANPDLSGTCVGQLSSRPEQFGQIQVSTAKSTISRLSRGKSHAFLQQYERVRATRTRDLDPMVYILSKILENPDLKKFVEKKPVEKEKAELKQGPSAPNLAISDTELEKLKSDLAAASNSITLGGSGLAKTAKNTVLRGGKSCEDFIQMPDWVSNRNFLTSDFPRVRTTDESKINPVGSFPLHIQELAIVDDLLYIMAGVEGKYISIIKRGGPQHKVAIEFEIDSSLDSSLRDLATRMLPLAIYYSTIAHFLDASELYQNGMVRQAVSAAMQSLVKEYLIVVAQLETQFSKGELSLQGLWFYLQPCIRTLEVLAKLVNEIAPSDSVGLRGGALLSVLHTNAMNQLGDTKSQDLCFHLAQAGSVPYFNILEQWIYKGVIDDPYGEFLVKEEKGVRRDQAAKVYNDVYWEQRYTVCPDRTPKFLTSMADKILRTGKYLNVIRESGRSPQYPKAVELEYQLRDRAFISVIEEAYAYASKSLLYLINTDLKLMDQLKSIKSYFCMQLGDFFSHFLDIAEGELSKIVKNIEPSRLGALLELALRVSSASHDPFKDQLKFKLVPHNLVTELHRIMKITHDFQGNERGFVNPENFSLEGPDSMAGSTITGLEAFTFEYEVQWPVSLIISRKSIKRYQLIFRHLFKCRQVELKLCRTWLDDQFFKDTAHDGASARAAAFALRQRMLNFVQSFQYYTMFEVIEPNWHLLEKKLEGASTIDDVLDVHNNFLDTCLKECMLTNPASLRTISKLLSVCSIFSTGMKSLSGENSAKSIQVTTSKKFETSINQFNTKFTDLMYELLDSLTNFGAVASEQHMSNMVARLDFNGYYTSQRKKRLDEEEAKKQSSSSGGDHATASSSTTSTTTATTTTTSTQNQPMVV